jgi:outer membrane receptor protein involved in Fe transport
MSGLTAVNTTNLSPTTGLVLPIAPGYLAAHEFSPRVSVQYKFSPTLNVYGTIARGFTPGDEIDRLYLFQQLTGSMITDLTTNVGPSTNYGAEFDISAPLPGGFRVSAGMGALRATWGEVRGYVNPVTSLPIPLSGLTVPFAPAYTANTSLDWKHDFGGYDFAARAAASFIGRSYWDPQDAAYQQAYHLVNLSSWVDRGIWKVTASVTNLTQTEYNTIYWTAADVGAPFNIARINRPREFIVSSAVRF